MKIREKLEHFVARKKQSKYDDSLLISLDEATRLLELAESHAQLLASAKALGDHSPEADREFNEAIEQAEKGSNR